MRLAASLIALCVSAAASAQPPAIWKDDFAGVRVVLPDGSSKLYPDPHRWAFTFRPGIHWPDIYGDGVNWLEANAECQIYLSPFTELANGKRVPAALRYDPFSIERDGLHIHASVLSAEQQALFRRRPGQIFGSGLLISREAFQYGTFTLTARLPAKTGVWPAFWLLPNEEIWPPELDVFEAMPWAQHQRQLHAGLISLKAENQSFAEWFDLPSDPTTGFHKYQLHWTAQEIAISYDGETLLRRPTPPSLRRPMYVLVNLAVGGKWVFNEMGVPPIDGVDSARLERGAKVIGPDFAADMVLRSLTISPE